jgi:hypothetical protein
MISNYPKTAQNKIDNKTPDSYLDYPSIKIMCNGQ